MIERSSMINESLGLKGEQHTPTGSTEPGGAASMRTQGMRRVVIGLLCSLPAVARAEPMNYTFSRVAGTEELYSFVGAPTISNDGTVYFIGTRPGVGLGVFAWNGGAVTPLFTSAGPLGGFQQLAVSNNGILTFTASYNVGGGRGVFTYDGTTLTTVADTRTSPIFGVGDPRVNNDGTVTFRATLNSTGTERALYTGNGGPLTRIADSATFADSAFLYAGINNKGVVAFSAGLAGENRGIYVSDGTTLTRLYAPSAFTFLSSSSGINDDGRVVFLANFGGGVTGVGTGDGGPITIVGARTDGIDDFIAAPVINNRGEVAYAAGPGIFTGPDRDADRVLRIGDTIFGQDIRGFGLGQGQGLNDDGQLTFIVRVRDPAGGSDWEIIVRADPVVPEPSTLALLGVGALGLLGYRRLRRKRSGIRLPEAASTDDKIEPWSRSLIVSAMRTGPAFSVSARTPASCRGQSPSAR
jgi:hypothetical protein